ncbi:MAG: tetratricopeptide repeat protein [Bacteroidetes bacterium]|nr:tetratricopeptide repeat protein [Bacteroidota bacterium]
MNQTYTHQSGVFLFIIILLFTSSWGFSGNIPIQPSIDSLKHMIINGKRDPGKLSVLYAQLAREYYKTGSDSCVPTALTGLKLAENAGCQDGIRSNCIYLGLCYLKSDSLNLAKKYLLKALVLINLQTDPLEKMRILNGLGYISDLQSDYAGALKYYMQGKKVAEETVNNLWRADFLNNIAAFYNSAGMYQKSVGLFKEASNIYSENKDSTYYANSLVNLGRAYLGLKKFDSAITYYNLALPIQLRLKNYYGLANLYLGLTEIKIQQSKLQDAIDLLKIGMEMIDSLDKGFHGSGLFMKVDAEQAMGLIYLKMKEYRQAESHYRIVRKLAQQGSFLQYETEAIKGLSEVMEKKGQKDSALFFARLYQKYSDSLWQIRDNQKIILTELEFAFKNDQEKNKIEIEKQQVVKARNNLIYILIFSIVVGTSMVFLLLYLLQRNKARHINLVKKNLELENINLEKDIDLKNKELLIQSINLAEKKEVMSEMSDKLQGLIDSSVSPDDNPMRNLLRDFKNKNSENFWDEFNARFRDVHPQFYSSLTKDHPGLTPNEIKLCAFIRLNLTTKEIELLTRKSENTIKIARHRLRHKLGLGREENLTSFLNKF